MIDRLLTTRLPKATDATRNRYMALIRAIFRKAQREWEWVDQIPAFKAYGEGSKIRVRHLTHEQAEALLEALPDHQREVVLFALTTGLRQGNILGLTWDRVDMARRMATIGHGDTKNGNALGVPVNEVALAVVQCQSGQHPTHEIGRAHDHTPVNNAQLGRRLLAENKKSAITSHNKFQ